MATLSPASPSAAEALLHRARRLSNNAYNEYERSRPTLTPSIPTAFAEGEELILSSSSSSTLTPSSSPSTSISLSKLSSPSLSPTSCLKTASLHQKHRESFDGIVREHGRKRSSAQRNSSASTASTSSLAKISNPASSLSSDPSTSPVTMVITPSSSGVLKEGQEQEQQTGQGPRGEQGDQKQDQRQQQESEGAEGRQQEQPKPHPLTSSSASSVALSSSPNDASMNTKTTTASSAQTSTPTPTPSLLCPTITQTTTTTTIADPSTTNRHSLTIVTRPRALTLESIRELRESTSDHPLSPPATSTTLAPMDHHRKHRSELGSNASIGLVRGVMEALRDNEQQSQQQAIHARARSTPGWALSLPETHTPTPTPTTAFLPQADLDVRMMMNKDQVIATPASSSSWTTSPSSLPEQLEHTITPSPFWAISRPFIPGSNNHTHKEDIGGFINIS
ncbi:hypothetical protein BKA57DRAFT_439034 [Linnemannia elongata]|nr:hypothetical protein BKA57DRAFT_439034 [Linnemannia elongata]